MFDEEIPFNLHQNKKNLGPALSKIKNFLKKAFVMLKAADFCGRDLGKRDSV